MKNGANEEDANLQLQFAGFFNSVGAHKRRKKVELVRLLENPNRKPRFGALTNTEGRTISRHADLILPLCAGEEATISTKTHRNTLGVLYLMAAALAGAAGIDTA